MMKTGVLPLCGFDLVDLNGTIMSWLGTMVVRYVSCGAVLVYV